MLAVDRNDFERVQYIVGVDRTYVNYQDPRVREVLSVFVLIKTNP